MDIDTSVSLHSTSFLLENVVAELLRSWDPLLIGMIALPVGLICSAWALRMACAICAVKVPEIVPAAAVVMVSVVVNVALRIALHSSDLSLGFTSQVLLLLLITALIIALSVRTSIPSALAVAITHILICGLMYVGVSEVGQAML